MLERGLALCQLARGATQAGTCDRDEGLGQLRARRASFALLLRLGSEAPRLWPHCPGNVCFRWARGDEGAVRKAFQSAAHTVAVDVVNNRLVGAAIEPRAVMATAEPGDGKLTLYTGRGTLANHKLTTSFSGAGTLGGGYTFTYHGTYR